MIYNDDCSDRAAIANSRMNPMKKGAEIEFEPTFAWTGKGHASV